MKLNMMCRAGVLALCIPVMLSSLLPVVGFGADMSQMLPRTPVAVFDMYGNNYEGYGINPSVSIFSSSGEALSERPSADKIASDYQASTLSGVHPRVIASAEDFERIKAAAETDDKIKEIYDTVIENADTLLTESTLEYELRDGVRLWYVSMDFIDRMLTLSMAYRLTDDIRYARRGYKEMNAIALFDTWHPEHHIDVGGIAIGYAIGYDWLYESLSAEERQSLERAANRLCFMQYADGLQNRSTDMKGGILASNNHNAVMNSGGIMMAEAFYDTDPDTCSYIISNLIRATEYTVKNLVPDGSWYEGISYAAMMVEYYSLELSALDKLFGSLYGLDEVEGTGKAVDFIMNLQCATGSFGYGDGTQGKNYNAGMLYMLDKFGYDSRNFESSVYYRGTDMSTAALSLLWYKGENKEKPLRDLDAFYPRNSVATARSSWDSEAPAFVGMKGASPKDTHAHMDVGTFSFYSDGVEWTYDNGAEEYNVDGYWDYSSSESGRWQYYRTRPEAHNCIVINPSIDGGYEPDSRSEFTRFESNDSEVIAVLDMKNAHGDKAQSALRGYYFCDTRQSLVVRDEIIPTTDGNVAWFMSTRQTPEIIGDDVYLYDSSGKSLKIEFASNCGYELYITGAEPLEGISPTPAGNSENPGVSRIVLMLSSKANEALTLTAKLTPESAVNPGSVEEYDVAVSSWSLKQTLPVVKLSTDAPVSLLPVGTSFNAEVQSYGAASTDVLKLYEVNADGTEKEVNLGEYNKYNAIMTDEEKYIVAKLFDETGNEISNSQKLSLKAAAPQSKKTVWDVDFENVTTDTESNLKTVTFYGADGKALVNEWGNNLIANRSVTEVTANSSVVELAECPVGDNGKSIHLVSKKSDNKDNQAQLNRFGVTLTEGVAVMEMDYLFMDFNTSKIVAGLNCKDTDGNAFWPGMLTLGTDGRFKFGEGRENCELNRWYNVKLIYDIGSGALSCILDGVYIDTVYQEVTTASTTRYSFQLTCMADTEAYADNFKVTNLIYN